MNEKGVFVLRRQQIPRDPIYCRLVDVSSADEVSLDTYSFIVRTNFCQVILATYFYFYPIYINIMLTSDLLMLMCVF